MLSTEVMGGWDCVVLFAVAVISENALFDSLTALSLLIAFYYALTGVACEIYFRRRLLSSVKNLLLIGVGPVVGAVLLGRAFARRE